MSAGAVFRLIANDGKADKIIMATDLLNNRLDEVYTMRDKMALSDATPTLVDIEQTHILFVNAHFKPFAAIGYEYNKVQVSAGTPSLGSQVQFSIPQFGDFFSDMVMHCVVEEAEALAGTYPSLDTVLGTTGNTSLINTSATNAQSVNYRVMDNTNNVVKPYGTFNGAVLNAAWQAYTTTNLVRYCDFPGMRLLASVGFDVNGNPLDSYKSDDYVMWEKFNVPVSRKTAWKRCVGQEVAVEGWTDVQVNNNNTFVRQRTHVLDGYQTPKPAQPLLDVWVPLIFWFNLDVRLSVPSVAIPYGMRFINVQLANQNELVFQSPAHYLEKVSTTMLDDGVQANGDVLKTTVTRYPILGTGVLKSQKLTKIELYINNIFVNPEIHEIYIRRIGFTLVRVHRSQTTNLTAATSQTLLTSLKYPIEVMYSGVRYVSNKVSADNWHRFTDVNDRTLNTSKFVNTPISTVEYDGVPTTADLASVKTYQLSAQVSEPAVNYKEENPIVQTVAIDAHGISIYQAFDNVFYNSYLPYVFSGVINDCPIDKGVWMINFSLFPGSYQPSGHMNVSRAREFYINIIAATGMITADKPVDLVVDARALNFLLISDGSAVLRYNT